MALGATAATPPAAASLGIASRRGRASVPGGSASRTPHSNGSTPDSASHQPASRLLQAMTPLTDSAAGQSPSSIQEHLPGYSTSPQAATVLTDSGLHGTNGHRPPLKPGGSSAAVTSSAHSSLEDAHAGPHMLGASLGGSSLLDSGTFEQTHNSVLDDAFFDSAEMSSSDMEGGSLADQARKARMAGINLAGIGFGDKPAPPGKPPVVSTDSMRPALATESNTGGGGGLQLQVEGGNGSLSPVRASTPGDSRNSGRAGGSLSQRRKMGLQLNMSGGVGGGSSGDVDTRSAQVASLRVAPESRPESTEGEREASLAAGTDLPDPTAGPSVEGDCADWEWNGAEWVPKGSAANAEQYAMSESGVIDLGNGLMFGKAGLSQSARGKDGKPQAAAFAGGKQVEGGDDLSMDDARVFAAAARHYARKHDVGHELVMLNFVGKGASGSVKRALHLPTMQMVAVKSVRVYDVERRNQMASELKTLYANMVPLRSFTERKAVSQPSGGALGVLGASAALDGTMGGTLSASDGEASQDKAAAPNLVKFFDAFTVPSAGTVNIVMEYMGGGSWEDIVERGGCQNEAILALMARQALQGLAFLHDNKQLHRDIKPANILCTSDGLTHKLADFGIAKQLSETHEKAQTWVGTMVYMSPERIGQSDAGYSYPSDVWSLGLSLLAVAAGRFPYAQTGYWEISKSMKDDPPPLHVLREPPGKTRNGVAPNTQVPTYSQSLFDFMEACLTKDPARRPTAHMLLYHPFLAGRGQHVMATDTLGSTLMSSSLLDDPEGSDLGAGNAAVRDLLQKRSQGKERSEVTPELQLAGRELTGKAAATETELAQLVVEVLDKKWPEFVSFYRRVLLGRGEDGSGSKARRKDHYELDESTFNDQLAARFIVQRGLSKTMTRRIEARISVAMTATLGGTAEGLPPRPELGHRRSSSGVVEGRNRLGLLRATTSNQLDLSGGGGGVASGDFLEQISKTQLVSAHDIRAMALAAKSRLSSSTNIPSGTAVAAPKGAWGGASADVGSSSKGAAASTSPDRDMRGVAGRATEDELAALGPENLTEMLTSRRDFTTLSRQMGLKPHVLRDAFNTAVNFKLHGKKAKHAFKKIFKPKSRNGAGSSSGNGRDSRSSRDGAAALGGSRTSLKDLKSASGRLAVPKRELPSPHAKAGGGATTEPAAEALKSPIGQANQTRDFSEGAATPHRRKADTVRTQRSGGGAVVSMGALVKNFKIEERDD